MSTPFYFAVCQIGAEKAVKAEVISECPSMRFCFSRPGFITFKDSAEQTQETVLKKNIFTRIWGKVIGKASSPEELTQLLSQIPAGECVHYYDRDMYVPGEEPEGWSRTENISKICPLADGRRPAENPQAGSRIYDVIFIDDFLVFAGSHIVTKKDIPAPSNIPPIVLPDDSPSRAWLKLEEAVYRFRPEIPAHGSALEVGCAPGGASSALISRGFTVTVIDPQAMADSVYSSGRFTHIRKPARFVTDEELRSVNPDWLVVDMSIPPREAMTELSHIMKTLRRINGKNLKIRSAKQCSVLLTGRNFLSMLYLKSNEEHMSDK